MAGGVWEGREGGFGTFLRGPRLILYDRPAAKRRRGLEQT